MKLSPPPSFDRAVRTTFARVLDLTKLSMDNPAEGVYEVISKHLSLRIRWQVGHMGCNLLLTMTSPTPRGATQFAGTGEIGLAHIVEFYGDGALRRILRIMTRDCTDEASMAQALSQGAIAAERFCIPLLLGLNDDWPRIRNFVEQKICSSPRSIKKRMYPPSVKPKWKTDTGNQ
jgi:hypothetical protein